MRRMDFPRWRLSSEVRAHPHDDARPAFILHYLLAGDAWRFGLVASQFVVARPSWPCPDTGETSVPLQNASLLLRVENAFAVAPPFRAALAG
jgi:hypothetical protein